MAATQTTLAALQAKSEGTLAPGVLRPKESLDAVWQHICEGLTSLAVKVRLGRLDLPENGLTQRLVDELERRPGERPYYFKPEDMEDDSHGHSPRVDLAVRARDGENVVMDGIPCAGTERFLVIEAKRLPTPRPDREREYLSGKRGGVERFKRGIHAKGLKTVGMVAYIQRHAFDYWCSTINNWIDELIAASTSELPWDTLDKLTVEEMSPYLARLRSNNLRVSDNERLTIRHVWVQMTSTAEPSQGKGRRRSAKLGSKQ
jgi:hypothetical protein